jgi:hypothetical protein
MLNGSLEKVGVIGYYGGFASVGAAFAPKSRTSRENWRNASIYIIKYGSYECIFDSFIVIKDYSTFNAYVDFLIIL